MRKLLSNVLLTYFQHQYKIRNVMMHEIIIILIIIIIIIIIIIKHTGI